MSQIYPPELQLNKANSFDLILNLDLSITNGIVSSKQDGFKFVIVNFPFLDRDVPRPPSHC